MKQTGLGKGLAALLSDLDDKTVASIPQKDLSEISLSLIDANPHQPRKVFEPEALKELSSSIKQHGVIQPVVLNKNGSRYLIIAGERRCRAAKDAGLETIPAIVRNYSERQIMEISLIENLQREDLNAIEAATAIKSLMDTYEYKQDEVAERLGKSRSQIANTLRLLNLSAPVIELVKEGRLSAGHARCLVVVEDPNLQLKIANAACDNKMSVRDLERKVKNMLTPETVKGIKPAVSIELKEFVINMQRVFATKVKILGNDNKGRICIDYFNRDDLDRITTIIEQLKNN